jgi:hypothetical protein
LTALAEPCPDFWHVHPIYVTALTVKVRTGEPSEGTMRANQPVWPDLNTVNAYGPLIDLLA